MPEKIDYQFLSELEGGSKTRGYVPAASVSKSGVTIATGFDLGQRNEDDLKSLKLEAPLITQLNPYLGIQGKDAQELLKKSPLTISSAQAEKIDKAVKNEHIKLLKFKYDTSPGNKKKFIDLPEQAQTVITSVSFQYGTGLKTRTPKFWQAVTSQNWTEAIKLLKSFGDVYPTRRKKEATLLEKIK
ncbi:pesticin C-terminus-like muramidase [Thalassomonas actiniarum]|uniref:Peptidase n=1 Tax=Thalassomonas actiniarum TaxID=485447 RepID=A0AAF0BXS3_9GAMM|nr:pesticin C-terminus-like muramidase [Thalassomonas actiniarum]WDD97191.1 peptidase [Thalassomonas actiniarum]